MSIFRLGAAAVPCLLAVGPLSGQGTKVGYINSEAILAEYGPAQEAARSLEATLAGYRAEIDQLQADWQEDVWLHAFADSQQHKRSPQQEQESVTPTKVSESGF